MVLTAATALAPQASREPTVKRLVPMGSARQNVQREDKEMRV